MPNLVYPFLYLGNILGIYVTCAVKSDKYLVDVRSDAFHQAITFGNFGTVGSEMDWQPFFGQNYSEQEITFTTVLILLT